MHLSVLLLRITMSQRTGTQRTTPLSQPLGTAVTVPFEFTDGVSEELAVSVTDCDREVHRERFGDAADGAGFSHLDCLSSPGIETGYDRCQPTEFDVEFTGDDVFGAESEKNGDECDLGIHDLSEAVHDSSTFFSQGAEPELQTDRLGDAVEPSAHTTAGFGLTCGPEWCAKTLSADEPKFFWEVDPFLRTVFCKDDSAGPSLKRPEPPIDLTLGGADTVWDVLRRPKRVASTGICADVIKHVEIHDEKDKRVSIISNWTSLVCINLDAFTLSETLLASSSRITHADVEMSLTACFSRKATSTLSKRFYALNKFVNHCCRNALQFFPVREHVVFTYLQHLVECGNSAPSAGRSLLEAIRFAGGVIGLKGDLASLGSSRVDGLAVELAKRAGPIRQAEPLTVQQVIALERLVASSDDLKDRIVFGVMLVLLYSCGRFSDGQRAINMIVDAEIASLDMSAFGGQGYLELQVLGHKGARTDVLRRTFLPLVAPIYSLGSVKWFQSWLQARDVLGLSTGGKLDKPFLCRFNSAGEPLNLELTSAECSMLLRRALKLDGEESVTIRSHSLKVTALSWCCKHGLDLGTRRLLGHHLDPGSRSAETYGRDSMAPAVRSFETVLDDIKKGLFRPDESRSGRFVRVGEASIPNAQPSEEDTAEDTDSDYEPSSSESDESEEFFGAPSDSSLLWHLVMPHLRPGFIEVPEVILVYRNVASGVQHLKKPGSLKLLCGRRQSDRYIYYAGKPVKGVALCDHCIGSRDLQATETSG